MECLTLAVGNAKSHPFSTSLSDKQEVALSFLSELEDLLEVAQIQIEIQNALSSRVNESDDLRQRYQLLQNGLFNITEVSGSHFHRVHPNLTFEAAVSTIRGALRSFKYEIADFACI